MLTTLAISNYRSLLNLTVPLGRLNLITGPNGTGKSNLYRALRLLSETAQGGVVHALAREGGIQSSLWAGPENISREMRNGSVAVQGGPRKKPVRLRLGFTSEDFGYAISLGLPPPGDRFSLDPQIKRECIRAAESSQIWVVSHAKSLIAALQEDPDCRTLELEKELGVTQIRGQGILDAPAWNWAD